MDVGLIGYRNHAARLLGLLLDLPGVGRVRVYHPDAARLRAASLPSPRVEAASDLADLLGLDAVVVASPNATHVAYVQALAAAGRYVYCEKPPAATREGVEALRALPPAQRRRVFFGFNHRFSELAQAARGMRQQGGAGALVHLGFVSTHGLALRPSYAADWRAADDALGGILGSLGIHYLDLCQWLLGPPDELSVARAAHSRHARGPDTVHLRMTFRGGPTASVFLSYAAPLVHRAQAVFHDAVLDLDGGTLRLLAPRDTLDAAGHFAAPPAKELLALPTPRAYYDLALRRALQHFLDTARQGGAFRDDEYELSLRSNELVLEHARGPVSRGGHA